ncbi:UNVERIFIED_CONTAM: hypothetical protein FKN15_068432 [Acipenser sinensis]
MSVQHPDRGEYERPAPRRGEHKHPAEGNYLLFPPPPAEGDYLLFTPPTAEEDCLQLPPPPSWEDYLLLPPPSPGGEVELPLPAYWPGTPLLLSPPEGPAPPGVARPPVPHCLGLPHLHLLGLPRLHRLGLPRLHRLGLPRLHRLGLPRLHRLGLPSLHRLGPSPSPRGQFVFARGCLHATARGCLPVITQCGVKSSSSLCAAGKFGAGALEKVAAGYRTRGRSGDPAAAFLARGSPPEFTIQSYCIYLALNCIITCTVILKCICLRL